jgi:hypothetical protein
MGKRIGRLWCPTHHPILHDELNPLGGSVSSYRAQTVLILVFVPCQDTSLGENFFAEVGAEAVLQLTVLTETGGKMLSYGIDYVVELRRQ